jgi:hypothetical protein
MPDPRSKDDDSSSCVSGDSAVFAFSESASPSSMDLFGIKTVPDSFFLGGKNGTREEVRGGEWVEKEEGGEEGGGGGGGGIGENGVGRVKGGERADSESELEGLMSKGGSIIEKSITISTAVEQRKKSMMYDEIRVDNNALKGDNILTANAASTANFTGDTVTGSTVNISAKEIENKDNILNGNIHGTSEKSSVNINSEKIQNENEIELNDDEKLEIIKSNLTSNLSLGQTLSNTVKSAVPVGFTPLTRLSRKNSFNHASSHNNSFTNGGSSGNNMLRRNSLFTSFALQQSSRSISSKSNKSILSLLDGQSMTSSITSEQRKYKDEKGKKFRRSCKGFMNIEEEKQQFLPSKNPTRSYVEIFQILGVSSNSEFERVSSDFENTDIEVRAIFFCFCFCFCFFFNLLEVFCALFFFFVHI